MTIKTLMVGTSGATLAISIASLVIGIAALHAILIIPLLLGIFAAGGFTYWLHKP